LTQTIESFTKCELKINSLAEVWSGLFLERELTSN